MLKEDLRQFYGSEQFYRICGDCVITEGVKYFGDKAEAYWLINDIVINCKMNKSLKDEDFVSVYCKKPENMAGIFVEYEDGNGNKLYQDYYPHSSLPDSDKGIGYNLWFVDNMVLLPSEY